MIPRGLGVILVALTAASAFGLENESFESTDALQGWQAVVMTQGGEPVIRADQGDARDGKQSLFVEASDPADIAIVQKLALPAGTLWRASCWIRTEDLQPDGPAGTGGTIEIRALDNRLVGAGPAQFGTSPWREVKVPFRVGDSGEVNLVLFFVGFGKGTGKAWFDAVRLERIEPGGAGPVPITGKAVRGWEALDEVMLKYRDRIGCSAATLAISMRGRLLYNRGYGWLDREWRVPTDPDTMMGIASCDKPITAAAIRRVIRRWRRGTDTRLFDVLQVKPQGPVADPRIENITIGHLITHTAGWGGNPCPRDWATAAAHEAGFEDPIAIEVLLGFVVTGKLKNPPGAKEEYCNFGYDVLRRIVERASGKTFAEYACTELLGQSRMRGFHDPSLAPRQGDPPLVWNYQFDAGEVSASTPAMCRFMERYWMNGEPRGGTCTWSFFGSLPNTTAIMAQRPDNINIAAVFNGRSDVSCDDINLVLQQTLERIMAAR